MKFFVKYILFTFSVVILFSGCFLQSLHPLITLDDAKLIDGIEGRWEGENTRWTFFRDSKNIPAMKLNGLKVKGEVSFEFDEGDGLEVGDNTYFMLYEDLENNNVDSTLFEVKFGDIGNITYMDLVISDIFRNKVFEQVHLIPVHTFSKISVNNDEIEIEFLASDWISDLIEDNRVRIKHEKVDDNILITESTENLRKFVQKYGDDPKAYEDPMSLKKVTDESN